MKKIIKGFQYVAIDFTVVLLIYSLINVRFSIGNMYVLELFGVVMVAFVIWNLVGKIRFKSYIGFWMAEYAAMYVLIIVGGLALKWYDFTVWNIVVISGEFIVTMGVITYVLVKKEKIECDEINELINERGL